jgi:hypothetical protein
MKYRDQCILLIIVFVAFLCPTAVWSSDSDVQMLIAKAALKHSGLSAQDRSEIEARYEKYAQSLRRTAHALDIPEKKGWAVKLVQFGQETKPTHKGNTLGAAMYERELLVRFAGEDCVALVDENLPFRKEIQLYPEIIGQNNK